MKTYTKKTPYRDHVIIITIETENEFQFNFYSSIDGIDQQSHNENESNLSIDRISNEILEYRQKQINLKLKGNNLVTLGFEPSISFINQ